jgi:hypothetical protein
MFDLSVTIRTIDQWKIRAHPGPVREEFKK